MTTSLVVNVVANNAQTTEALQTYLAGAGVRTVASAGLGDPAAIALETVAIVVFPDELDAAAVIAWIGAVRARHPSVLLLVVTGSPHTFRAVARPDGSSRVPLLLPKPAFGWTILDAIRAEVPPE